MSPPWLTSTTSASAASRRQSAIALRRPAGGRKPRHGLVGDHVDAAVLGAAGGDEAAGVGALAGRGRRIDRDHDALQAAAPRATRQLSMPRARPQRVGALLDDLAVELLAAEPRAGVARDHARRGTPAPDCCALARVPARVTAVAGSAISRLSSAIGRGVVVMTCRGRSPRRSPNCSMSKVASAWRHLASSSHQAAANCGPRRLSGSSAENACATAPFGHSSRRREGIQTGRSCAPMHREQAGDALDHHLAHVVLGLADERDRPDRRRRTAARRAPAPAPIRRRRGSCRRRGRRARARWSSRPGGGALMVVREDVASRASSASSQRSFSVARTSARQSGLRQARQCVAQVRDGTRRCLGGRGRHRRRLRACLPRGLLAPRRRRRARAASSRASRACGRCPRARSGSRPAALSRSSISSHLPLGGAPQPRHQRGAAAVAAADAHAGAAARDRRGRDAGAVGELAVEAAIEDVEAA